MLEVGDEELDADRCERLYTTARTALSAGDPARAAAQLRVAAALWQGPPLAEFTYEPFAHATIARLEELRVSCQEELIEAELALGRHAEIVSELEALVRRQPLRERFRAQLMLALYRCGRQAEALDAFQQARRMLVDELAVEPSEALRALEQAILRQDEAIRAPPVGPVADTPVEERDRSTAVEPSQAPPTQSGGLVRKTVTVLAATLTVSGPGGSTDPETTRRLIASAREQAQRIVHAHGGTFASGLGGEVVGVFGVPVITEDDALRALRAADQLRTQVDELSGGASGELLVRVGVDTGEVVGETPGDLFGEPLTSGIAFGPGGGAGGGSAQRRDAPPRGRRRSASSPRAVARTGG